jgi:CAAX protease family protein
VGKVLLGLAAALAIGIGEEAIFRGVVLRRLGRDFGMRSGVVVTTVIYAAVHVIRRRAGGGAVHVWSGIGQTVGLFAPLADARVIPQLLGLLLLGALLAAARLRARTLWLPIGIHAAFVAGFRVGRLFFDIRPAPAWLVGTGWPPLVGGAAGWVAIAVAGVLVCRRQ